jgi:hypothetical protein
MSVYQEAVNEDEGDNDSRFTVPEAKMTREYTCAECHGSLKMTARVTHAVICANDGAIRHSRI